MNPRMTKGVYEAAAELLQKRRLYGYGEQNDGGCVTCHAKICGAVEETFAAFFAADNPAFDADRFRRACVPGANVRARPPRNPTVRKVGPWPMRSVEVS